jgi:hypothetical protein
VLLTCSHESEIETQRGGDHAVAYLFILASAGRLKDVFFFAARHVRPNCCCVATTPLTVCFVTQHFFQQGLNSISQK